jgi:hypothetical protein
LLLLAIFVPPLTRASTARELCLAGAGAGTTVSWSMSAFPLPHWQCAIHNGSSEQVTDLGWWPSK